MVRAILFLSFIISTCTGYETTVFNDFILFQENRDFTESFRFFHDDALLIVTNTNKNITKPIENESVTEDGITVRVTDDHCKVQFKATLNRTGFWKFKYSESYTHNIFLIVSKDIHYIHDSPKRKTPENSYILETFPKEWNNFTACYLIKTIYTENADEDVFRFINLTDNADPNFQLVNSCGVRFKLDAEYEGEWYLIGMKESELAVQMSFRTNMYKPHEKFTPNESHLNQTVSRGSSKTLFALEDIFDQCIIKDPHGNIVRTIYQEKCKHDLSLVTSYHMGYWIFQYYSNEELHPREVKIFLNVTNDGYRVKTAMTRTENEITLLCNTTEQYIINTCKFISPTNEVINVFVGMVTDRYQYFGEDFGRTEYNNAQECGIVIRNPTTFDYGTWKCVVNVNPYSSDANSREIHSLIHTNEDAKIYETEYKTRVDVKRNESFVVQCKTNRRLSYCWLRSPNGTVYNIVHTSSSDSNTLQYHGIGFDAGECGTNVISANRDYDHGDWSCHMGIENGPDVKAMVFVFVSDSIVVPVEDKVLVVSSDDEVDLSCKAISGSQFANDHCRWVSPNGSDIVKDYDDRYLVSGDNKLCNLKIQGINMYNLLGKWTCFVSNGTSEISTSVQLYALPQDFLWIIVGVVFVLSLVLLVILYYLCNFMRKSLSNDNQCLVSDAQSIANSDIYNCRTVF